MPRALRLTLLIAASGCGAAPVAPSPAVVAIAPPVGSAIVAPPATEGPEPRWARQLQGATAALRDRARSLLDVCSVVEEPGTEDYPTATLSCVYGSFGTPRAAHEFRIATKDDQTYGDAHSEVTGSFVLPGAEERLIMFWGGSNGSSGGTSGLLFRHVGDDWPLVKTFVSFPATSCAAVARAGRTSLLLCGFDNHWQGMTNVWASLFDAATPLKEDNMNAPEPTAEYGWLPPLQTVLQMGDEDRAANVYVCPNSIRSTELLPEAPAHVSAAPDGATLTFAAHTVTLAAARKKMCHDDAPYEAGWPVHHLTYELALRGDRLITKPSPARARQDAELRRLVVVPPP